MEDLPTEEMRLGKRALAEAAGRLDEPHKRHRATPLERAQILRLRGEDHMSFTAIAHITGLSNTAVRENYEDVAWLSGTASPQRRAPTRPHPV